MINSIKNFVGNVVLFIIAIISLAILSLWGIVETIIDLFAEKRFWKAISRFGDWFKSIAIILDVLGNIIMQVPFNRILIKPHAYQFGNRYHTISYVLGVNQQKNTLTANGQKLVSFLDWFSENHCLKAVQKVTTD